MARFREQPCKNYICDGECQIGRVSDYKGYCQHCSQYIPRANVKTENMKKSKLYKLRSDYD